MLLNQRPFKSKQEDDVADQTQIKEPRKASSFNYTAVENAKTYTV